MAKSPATLSAETSAAFADLAAVGARWGKRINEEKRGGRSAADFAPYGWLLTLDGNKRLRHATKKERAKSEEAGKRAPYDGSFLLDGIRVWVDG